MTTNKLIIFSYPYELDTESIQTLFGKDTTVLIEPISRTVIVQYISPEEAGYYYVKHGHKLRTLHYCTEEQLEHFLHKQYTYTHTPSLLRSHLPPKRARESSSDVDRSSNRQLFSNRSSQ